MSITETLTRLFLEDKLPEQGTTMTKIKDSISEEHSCPECGCVNYTQHGITMRGQWSFKCRLDHTWSEGDINNDFPWRDDDPNGPYLTLSSPGYPKSPQAEHRII